MASRCPVCGSERPELADEDRCPRCGWEPVSASLRDHPCPWCLDRPGWLERSRCVCVPPCPPDGHVHEFQSFWTRCECQR